MEWFYADENDEQLPMAEADIERLISEGTIKPDTLIWNESMADWTASEKALPHLFQTPAETPPTAIASAPPQNQPTEGDPPALNAAAPHRPPGPADGLAMASLITGIIGVVGLLCASGFLLPVSIASVICGHIGRKRLREAGLPLEHGQLTAGLVLGWIGLGLSVLFLIGMLVYFIFIGAMVASEVAK